MKLENPFPEHRCFFLYFSPSGMKTRGKIWQIRKIAVPLHPLFVATGLNGLENRRKCTHTERIK